MIKKETIKKSDKLADRSLEQQTEERALVFLGTLFYRETPISSRLDTLSDRIEEDTLGWPGATSI